MKTKYSLLVALLLLVTANAKAQTKIVELPGVAFSNTQTIEIGKVMLSDTATVLDIEAFFRPGYWIKIVSDSYLKANGNKYMIRSGEGIDLDSLFWMPESGRASFSLTFEPLPIDTESFDFIESDCEECFKIWGISMNDKYSNMPEIPEEYMQEHQPEEDLEIIWNEGDALISGIIAYYVPGSIDWELIYTSPITGNENSIPVEVDQNGEFSTNITVHSATNLYLISPLVRIPIKVAPGKESKVFVNQPEIYRKQRSNLQKDLKPYGGDEYYYAGYLSKLNTELRNKDISYAMNEDYSDTIVNMNVNEYKNFMMKKYRESISHNNTLDISLLAKKIINSEETFLLASRLSFAENEWIFAYSTKHNVPWEAAQREYQPVNKADDYNDYFELIPYDDMYLLMLPAIPYNIRFLSYAREDSSDPYEITRYLAQHDDVSEEDKQFLSNFISSEEDNETFEEEASVESIYNKYMSLAEDYMNKQMGAGFLSKIWNTDEGLMFDLIKAQKITEGIKDFNPLTKEQIEDLSDLPDEIKQIILEENELLIAKLEDNKKKTGFTVLNTPTNVDEELFVEMLKPFKGKVILVDVWATWCGPCRSANIAMEPLKAELADEEDLVYLYLAGEDSPENTWNNMIVDLKGHHYRVNNIQWNYLRESLNARGVPTYIIIDREGNHIFHSVGFPGADTMKSELMKALGK